jgi:hypothetical protein
MFDRDMSTPSDSYDEVSILAAFHLEAWTDETSDELFRRACTVLRSSGIRVKIGWMPPEPESDIIWSMLYDE